jgi:hypothetical protein
MSNLDLIQSDCIDYAIHIGATFSIDMYFTQGCDQNGLPVNLTGYSAQLVIIDQITKNIIETITGTISNPLLGVINFELSSSETEDLIENIYDYFLNLSFSGKVYRVANGKIEVAL